jgi:hypothetical protein
VWPYTALPRGSGPLWRIQYSRGGTSWSLLRSFLIQSDAYFFFSRAPERGLRLAPFARLSSMAVSSLHHSPAST